MTTSIDPALGRAWVFTKRGSPQLVLRLAINRPIPTAAPPLPLPKDAPQSEEWVAIRVAYAALNPGGVFHIKMLPSFLRSAEAVPEMELSGTIVDVWTPDSSPTSASTSTTPRFAKGSQVLALIPVKHTFPTGTGALASHVAIPARYVVPKPAGMSLSEASGLLNAGAMAWQMVQDAKVHEGQRVLLYGGAGGVGSLALQMVRNIVGPEGFVVAVASGRNIELLKELGADEAIDYTLYKPVSAELAARYAVLPFDVVLDCVGIQDVYLHSPKYLVAGGLFVSAGIKPPMMNYPNFLRATFQIILNSIWPVSPWLGGVGRRWIWSTMMDSGPELLEKLANIAGEGKLKVVVDSVWSMEDALKGYAVLEGGHARGKVVIKVDEEAAEQM